MKTINVDGTPRPLAKDFGTGRAIVDYDGLFVIVEWISERNCWDLSGEPARVDELPVLAELVAGIKTEVTVTAPDGTITTFNDGDGT